MLTNRFFSQSSSSTIQSKHAAEFVKWLKRFRQESGKSFYRLEQDTGITAAYLWRLEHGERSRPTPDILMLLTLGLVLEREELIRVVETANTLLSSAGYAPLLHLPRLSDEYLNPPPTRSSSEQVQFAEPLTILGKRASRHKNDLESTTSNHLQRADDPLTAEDQPTDQQSRVKRYG